MSGGGMYAIGKPGDELELGKGHQYEPRDRSYRGGFHALVSSCPRGSDVVEYWCGGQRLSCSRAEFRELYCVK